MKTSAILRFAPSPTGYLHLGGLRTALYNYLLAKQTGGEFILRIEDTDQKRLVPDAENDIMDSLRWAGLICDAYPGSEMNYGPLRQTERTAIYLQYAQQLMEQGFAYIAFDTPSEIQEMKARQTADGKVAPKYDYETRMSMKNSLTMPADEVAKLVVAGTPHVVRLKLNPRQMISFADIIRGPIEISTEILDDQILVKSDGLPTYHLASVVDDHLMNITHVIRGEEWIASTPKHIFLYDCLGWNPPSFAHLPLIMSPNGGKLSKRKAQEMGIPIAIKEYRDMGIEPEALLNYLALLGWNPGNGVEVFDLDSLIANFSLERIRPSGMAFDLTKLMWHNHQVLSALSLDQFTKRAMNALNMAGISADVDYLKSILQNFKSRFKLMKDILDDLGFFFQAPVVDKIGTNLDLVLLKDALQGLLTSDFGSDEEIKAILVQVCGIHDQKFGTLAKAIRGCLMGRETGPDLLTSMMILGKSETCNRLDKVIYQLG